MTKPSDNILISGDIDKQILGLTAQHIQYLTDDDLTNKSSEQASVEKTSHVAPKTKPGIHQQMVTAFTALKESAQLAGLDLEIASGFRSFERQLQIWNNKFTGRAVIKDAEGKTVDISRLSDKEIIKAILLYSALPGASRHHWGCDIDVYAPNLLTDNQSLKLEPWEYQQCGPMEKLSSWLGQHAEEFGFYLPYNKYRGGVAEEPWHLSFLPLARQYQEKFNIDTLQACLMNTNIAGKMGIIENLPDIAKRYINNVNKKT